MIELQKAKVLVTGGSGFLGSHVIDVLKACGTKEVFAPSHKMLNIESLDDVERNLRAISPDVLIHCAAACGGIGANIATPADFFSINMRMGLNIADAIVSCGLAAKTKLVFIGTTCSYPRDASQPYVETDLFAGYPEPTNAAYGIAKRAMLPMLQAYQQQSGLQFIYLLLANLYGPRDRFDLETSHVVPALIQKIENAVDNTVVLWGTGRATRDMLFVEDAARLIVQAVERYDIAEPMNIGTGTSQSIDEIFRKLCTIMNPNVHCEYDPGYPDGQPKRQLDITRMIEMLGNDNKITALQDGLTKTVDWYRQNVKQKEK